MSPVYSDPNTKLDLPGTGEEFARLRAQRGGQRAMEVIAEAPKPFYFRASGQAMIAGGVATVSFGKPPVGYYWLIERVVVRNGGAGSQAIVYVGDVAEVNVADFTDAAISDVADNSSPIYVPSTDVLQVRVSLGTNGNVFSVGIQARSIPV